MLETRSKSSYFELPRRLSQPRDSHEDVSPLTRPAATPPHEKGNRRRPRLNDTTRSRSDDIFTKPRIQTIEEDVDMQHSAASPSIDIAYYDNADKAKMHSTVVDLRTRISLEDISKAKSLRSGNISQSEISSWDIGPSFVPRSSKLSSIWNKSLARTSMTDRQASSRDSTGSSREAHQHCDATEGTPILIQPLRPPSMATRYSLPISEHRIKVEESFPDHRAPKPDTVLSIHTSHRSSSLDARQLFSMPFTLFRKIRKIASNQTTQDTEQNYKNLAPPGLAPLDHPTNLRKHETENILMRVTSMLQEVKAHGTRNMPDKSSAASTSRLQARSRANGQLKSPGLLARIASMEISIQDTESQSSSLARLKMGHTPHNTPDEQAKYTIINQLGEREEFFKVDISIRGRTSYLPSEARRIHTPPLPEDGCPRKRRGFFFDYNLPSADQKYSRTFSDDVSDYTTKRRQEASVGDKLSTPVPTFNQPMSLITAKIRSRAKASDWYDTQLAEVDALVEDAPDCLPAASATCKPQAVGATFDAMQQRISDEAQLDYNIPEHYPTSPLCPRHPRYWRITKNKGTHFRGCWMHGYGEFSVTEMAKYGILTEAKEETHS